MASHRRGKKNRSKRPYRPGARERILDAASRLIYAEGLQAATVDRILAESTAHRGSFYAHFDDREDLTEAYIRRKGDELFEMTARLMEKYPAPDRFLKAWIRLVLTGVAVGQYHGCPFANIVAQGLAGDTVRDGFARWHGLFSDYFRAAPDIARKPAQLADECLMIYEGGVAMYRITGDTNYIKKIPELILARL